MDPHKKLAYAVLFTAIKDVRADASISGDARYFLLSDETYFDFWCQVAGLDPDVTRRRMKEAISRKV